MNTYRTLAGRIQDARERVMEQIVEERKQESGAALEK